MSDDDTRKRQQFLFGPPDDAKEPRDSVVEPAAVDPELRVVAAQLPVTLRLGTSSWSFVGWNGIVYAPGTKQNQLAHGGLAAYGKHPLLRTVGIDRTFYAPIAEDLFAQYAVSVPPDFRFLVKAWSEVTTPRLRGANGRPGKQNPRWLDVTTTLDHVLTPAVLGLGERLGPLLFQFPPQGAAVVREPQRFAERLHAFLTALPKGPCYATELRDHALFTDDYVQAVAAAGARHCYSVHPSMPSIPEQRARALPYGEVVVRWMLQPGSQYADAVERYEPFDRLVDPDPVRRAEVADVVAEALSRSLPVTVVVNNKAEGSSPRSLELLARAIRDRCPQPPSGA